MDGRGKHRRWGYKRRGGRSPPRPPSPSIVQTASSPAPAVSSSLKRSAVDDVDSRAPPVARPRVAPPVDVVESLATKALDRIQAHAGRGSSPNDVPAVIWEDALALVTPALPDYPAIARRLCETVDTVMSSPNKVRASRVDVIGLVVGAIRAHMRDMSVATAGCWALGRMIHNYPDNIGAFTARALSVLKDLAAGPHARDPVFQVGLQFALSLFLGFRNVEDAGSSEEGVLLAWIRAAMTIVVHDQVKYAAAMKYAGAAWDVLKDAERRHWDAERSAPRPRELPVDTIKGRAILALDRIQAQAGRGASLNVVQTVLWEDALALVTPALLDYPAIARRLCETVDTVMSSTVNKVRAAKVDVIGLVVGAIRAHMRDKSVATAGCWALGRMIHNYPDNFGAFTARALSVLKDLAAGPHARDPVLQVGLQFALSLFLSYRNVEDAASAGEGALLKWISPAVQVVVHNQAMYAAAMKYARTAWDLVESSERRHWDAQYYKRNRGTPRY